MLLSRTYQLATGDNARDDAKDAANKFLWRFNPRRLDAEEIRDSLLALSGNLDITPGSEQPFPPEMQWKYTQHEAFHGELRHQQAFGVFDAAAHPAAAVPGSFRWRGSERGHGASVL